LVGQKNRNKFSSVKKTVRPLLGFSGSFPRPIPALPSQDFVRLVINIETEKLRNRIGLADAIYRTISHLIGFESPIGVHARVMLCNWR
jgi:hypothetical protein